MLKISLYLLCWNEEVYIKKTIEYYKNRFPNISITIVDNYSTDNSIKIAKDYGAKIMYWGHKDKVLKYNSLEDNPHNSNWINEPDNTWILTCDMDELLDIDFKQLEKEDKSGTTIIKTHGYHVVGNSQMDDLSDISYYELDKGLFCTQWLSKSLLFKKGPIKKMNYQEGQHRCNPIGNINYSKNIYMIYHMKFLGLKYFINRNLQYKKRFKGVINNKKKQTIPKLRYRTV